MMPDDRLFPEAWDPISDYHRDRDPQAFLKRWEGVAPEVRGYCWSEYSGYCYATSDRPTNMTYDPGTRLRGYALSERGHYYTTSDQPTNMTYDPGPKN